MDVSEFFLQKLFSLTGKLPNIDWYAPTPIDSDKKAQILAALKVDAAQPLPDPNDNDPYWMGLSMKNSL